MRRDFFFGRYTCAICLGCDPMHVRFMRSILVMDEEVEGGYQAVHLSCYQELLHLRAVRTQRVETTAGTVSI